MIIYVDSCPVCGRSMTDKEALTYGVCAQCHTLKRSPFDREKRELREFSQFFRDIVGHPLWSLQESWAKKFIKRESFPIISPTGMGKTTFGIVAASYCVKAFRKKAYIILPTRILVRDVKKRLSHYLKGEVNIVSYTGKRGEKEHISSGDFDILITTGKFILRNYEILKNNKIGFFFVDDTDSVAKSSKLITYIREIKTDDAILILSSATIRPRGKALSLFREIFGFLPGGTPLPIRNIIDVMGPKDVDTLEKIINEMGDGGLLFFPRGKTNEMEKVVDVLRERGILCEIFKDHNQLEEFENGNISVLAHTASSYGKLIRGIDLPLVIRYVIFYGVPVFSFSLEDLFPMELFLKGVERIVKDRELTHFLDRFSRLSSAGKEKYREKLKEFVERYKKRDIIEELSKRFDIVVEEGTIFIPDAVTYIQGSGRTSRMYNEKLTMGASFVLEDNPSLIKALSKAIYTRFGETFDFEIFSEVNLRDISKKIDESRIEGREIGKLQRILLIVESPTKARTISRFFGTPTVKVRNGILFYEVFTGEEVLVITASKGHIYELTTDPKRLIADSNCIYGICKNGEYKGFFEYIRKCPSCRRQFAQDIELCPICEKPLLSQRDTVLRLREEAFSVDKILLVTDPDREGEKISYDLQNNLSGFDVKIERMELHEITKRAFITAKKNTRGVSPSLIDGYIFRRYEDRLIGFSLSQVLVMEFERKGLSAGRVQTPVLGWIIEKWRESRKKKRTFSFLLLGQRITFDEISHPVSEDERPWKVKILSKEEEREVLPLSPFDTSTLLSYCNRVFKLSAQEIMNILQDLFTNGFITYHRTDSKYISETGRSIAKSYLEMSGYSEYYFPRAWGEPGTHEGIRPTKPMDKDELTRWAKRTKRDLSFGRSHFAVYDAIFKRFITSQMKAAKLRIQKLTLSGPWEGTLEIERPVEVLDKGFTVIVPVKLYEKVMEETVEISPDVKKVPLAFPYTQAELIDLMKERGIGRPSTYAYIINTLLDRHFIIQRGKLGYLIPTKLGIEVYSFMEKRYPKILSEEKTRQMERTIDLIVEGEISLDRALDLLWEEVEEIKRDLPVESAG